MELPRFSPKYVLALGWRHLGGVRSALVLGYEAYIGCAFGRGLELAPFTLGYIPVSFNTFTIG